MESNVLRNLSKFSSVGYFVYSDLLEQEVALAEIDESDEPVLIDVFGDIVDLDVDVY
jgi:hypothetical protein